MLLGAESTCKIVDFGTEFRSTLLDFQNTRQIFLEQNYRSTGAILVASIAIISQGKTFYSTSRSFVLDHRVYSS